MTTNDKPRLAVIFISLSLFGCAQPEVTLTLHDDGSCTAFYAARPFVYPPDSQRLIQRTCEEWAELYAEELRP